MSVYEKYSKAKVEFHNTSLQKSGSNKGDKFGFMYFELSDIMPAIINCCSHNGLVSVVSFKADIATLKIIDIENGEAIEFTSPMSTAEMRACQPVQNLGAVETYIRRYLYLMAFDVIENDIIDADEGITAKPEKKPQNASGGQTGKTTQNDFPEPVKKPSTLTKEQCMKLMESMKAEGVGSDIIKSVLADMNLSRLGELSQTTVGDFVERCRKKK